MAINLSNYTGESALSYAPEETAPSGSIFVNAFDDEEDELGPDEEEDELFGDEELEGIDEEDFDLEEDSDLDGEAAWEDDEEDDLVVDDEEDEDL